MDYLSFKSWPFQEAKKIQNSKLRTDKDIIIFETGYGPSGLPHIGTFGEVSRTNMVRYCFEKLTGKKTKLIAFSDDMDGLRKIPDNIPNKEIIENYIDFPLTSVPDPFKKFKSFGEHNNKKLQEFLDKFNLNYQFQSSTNAYKSGLFNETIKKILLHYQDIKEVVLPTLGKDRRETYSPFFPVDKETGKILQVKIEDIDLDNSSVIFRHDNKNIKTSVLNGDCKLQWKVDWAMRWAAFGVDYEMCGKDLTDSYVLSSKICNIIGSPPPINLIYELFLDEKGEKISKSVGNGISIEEWLKYSNQESLSLFMFQRPTTAKKLHFDIIPKNTDEYLSHLSKYSENFDNCDNPAWHIHKSEKLIFNTKINFSLILNVISVCKSDKPEVILGLLKNYQSELLDSELKIINNLILKGINYFNDFIKPNLKFKIANKDETEIINNVIKSIENLETKATSDEFQTTIFSVGKQSVYKDNIKDFFKLIYEVVFGQDSGPRLGTFIKVFGKEKTVSLIKSKINV